MWRKECERAVLAVAFTPNGSEIASGGNDKCLTLRSTDTGDVVMTWPHTNHVVAVACCPWPAVEAAPQGSPTVGAVAARWWNLEFFEED